MNYIDMRGEKGVVKEFKKICLSTILIGLSFQLSS